MAKKLKSTYQKAALATVNARLKNLKDIMSPADWSELKDELNKINGLQWTKSGNIASANIDSNKARAIKGLIPTASAYKEKASQAQMAGLAKIGYINKVNIAFEDIMDMYYADWSGDNRIRNPELSKLPADLQGQLERMMSSMGKEYVKASDLDYNNITDSDWERLAGYLEQYKKLI